MVRTINKTTPHTLPLPFHHVSGTCGIYCYPQTEKTLMILQKIVCAIILYAELAGRPIFHGHQTGQKRQIKTFIAFFCALRGSRSNKIKIINKRYFFRNLWSGTYQSTYPLPLPPIYKQSCQSCVLFEYVNKNCKYLLKIYVPFHSCRCCGGEQFETGWMDWKTSTRGLPVDNVPDSCCHEYEKGCGAGVLR